MHIYIPLTQTHAHAHTHTHTHTTLYINNRVCTAVLPGSGQAVIVGAGYDRTASGRAIAHTHTRTHTHIHVPLT